MLALEDLVSLGEVLRGARFKLATQQVFAAQQLLLRLAADGALPATRAALASFLGPIFCTSAIEQREFESLYRDWLQDRFREKSQDSPVEVPTPPRPPVRAWIKAVFGGLALAALFAAWTGWQYWREREAVGPTAPAQPSLPIAQEPPRPDTAPVQASRETARPQLIAQFDVKGVLPPPTLRDRIEWRNVFLDLAPLLLWAVWYGLRRRRRPMLQRLASRTPPQIRDVHLPGGVRAILPGFPMRRLAQEMRRRRAVESSELQVEATIAATLRKGGIFTPVRGSRVEPDYIALVDRAGLSDHQALLAAEVVAELARSDVLVERYDFDRDATVCRPRDAAPNARQAGPGGVTASVELIELRERFPEHRVLVFGDGSGCFDGYTGQPAAWLGTLLLWQQPILLTPVAPSGWGRREWALQQLGVQVLPLSQQGLVALMGIVGGAPVETGNQAAVADPRPGMHERSARRWLERDPPAPASIEALCNDLRADLGARGFAWVAACAAYPEIHWGITLRLGPGLVADGAELERLVPRVVRLVWFREAYMPDWLRTALLERLDVDDEARAREILHAMLSRLVAGGNEGIPLRIATGDPTVELPAWRKAWNALRARSLKRRAQDLLRTAPADSPLRDYVFLRFLSGQSIHRLDFRAPGALLKALRAGPSAIPGKAVMSVLATSLLMFWLLPPVYSDGDIFLGSEARFSVDSLAGAYAVRSSVGRRPGRETPLERMLNKWLDDPGERTRGAALVRVIAEPPTWKSRVENIDGRILAIGAGAQALLFERGGKVYAKRLAGQGAEVPLAPADWTGIWSGWVFSEDGQMVAKGLGNGSTAIWALPSGQRLQAIANSNAYGVSPLAFSPDGLQIAIGLAGVVKIWNVRDGTFARDLPMPPGAAQTGSVYLRLAYSADRRRLAARTPERIDVWDIATGAAVRSLDLASVGSTGRDNSALSIRRDGRQVAIWSGSRTTLWNVDTGSSMALEGTGKPVFALAFSPDGGLLAMLDNSGDVRVWQTGSGEPLGPPLVAGEPGKALTSGALTFLPDGRTLAVSTSSQVSMWSVPAGTAPTLARRSYALIIGNNTPGSQAPLQSAVSDARKLAGVLRDRYGFDVTVLQDQSRDALIAAADRMASVVQADDRLLVFLAGHATRDPQGRYAFATAPRGASRKIDLAADVVYGDEFARRLANAPAREVLVLGDTSEALLLAASSARTGPAPGDRTRVLISSYTNGFPMETPAGSPFALALTDALSAADKGLTARTLVDLVTQRMAADKNSGGQRPSYRRMASAGDTGGDFSFPAPLTSAGSVVEDKAQFKVPQGVAKALAGLRFEVFVCQSVDEAGLAAAKRAQDTLRRLGAAEVRQTRLADETRQKSFLPVDQHYQIRITRGFDDETAAAKALLADAEFSAIAAWKVQTVQQQSKGYVSLLVCPPAGAPTPAGGVDNVLDLLSPALVAQMFPGTPQRDVESNLPSVRKALAEFGLTDRTMVLVALATIRAESSRLASTTETESRFNTSPGGRPFDLYDNRKDVGNQGAPDGERFRGRGFIRLFGRANYAAYGGAIGLGSALIDNPENAADPDIAAKVLAAFLKRREEAIRKAVAEDNLAAVRRMVSGGVTGLAVFTDTYNRGDKLLPKARASDISRGKASAN